VPGVLAGRSDAAGPSQTLMQGGQPTVTGASAAITSYDGGP